MIFINHDTKLSCKSKKFKTHTDKTKFIKFVFNKFKDDPNIDLENINQFRNYIEPEVANHNPYLFADQRILTMITHYIKIYRQNKK